MYIWKLAIRNLLGGGLRTWLNAFILSISFVLIIGCQGLYDAMFKQMIQYSVDNYYGGGHYWQENYDPFDALTLDDSHGRIPAELQIMIDDGQALPILKRQATLYPNNRVMNITLNGIKPGQTVLHIPTDVFKDSRAGVPALIGGRMANASGLREGDTVMLQWRDVNGTFDAMEIYISGIMHTNVGIIDQGQVWVPIDALQRMTKLPNESTLVVLAKDTDTSAFTDLPGWNFKSQDFLLADENAMITLAYVEGFIMYAVFLFLAMIGVFDTQILSIYRRVKEMGTMLALGITKKDLIRIFTLEGALYSILAAFLALLYGTPLLIWFSKVGLTMGGAYESFGFALDDTTYPEFGLPLVIITAVAVVLVTTITSYIPCRRIAKLTPTDALRGKLK